MNLEVLDGVALCMMFCFIQVGKGFLHWSSWAGVDGLVIDALVGMVLVRKLETLPELWHVENVVHIG